MNKLKLIIYSCLITLTFLSCLQNINAEQLNFTEKEKIWLSQKHTVRARVGGAPPLHFYDGKFRGISVEYLNLIAKQAGFEVQYIANIPWSTALKNIENHQRLDLILTAKNTPERQKVMMFTDDYLLMPYAIFCRKDNNTITSIGNLDFKKVSVEQDYVIHKKLMADYPNIKLIVKKTSRESIQAVALGEADAYIGNLTTTSYIIQKNNLTNLEVTAPTPFENHNQAMAIRDDWPELASIINKVFGTLTQEEHKRIQEKWQSASKDKVEISDSMLNLTPSEKAWLKAHPKIRVHNERNWPPFNYNLNNKPTGLSIDYMNILVKLIGIEVEYVTGEWSELLDQTINKKLDVMLNIVNTSERRKHLLYTGSYLKNPNVIITKEASNISGIESLFGKRVSFPSGFFYEELLKAQYPQIKRVPVKDLLASLKEVEFNRADAALGELAVVNYLIRENHLSDLVAKHEFSIGNPEIEKLNIAVRNDWPELQSILIKAMASVPGEDTQKLKNKWMHQTDDKAYESQEPQPGISVWRLSAYGLVIFLVISLLFWILRRGIKKEHISVKYGSTWFRLLVLAGLSFFLVVVFVIGWINLERSRKMHLEDESRFLNGVLSVFQDRLDLWLFERKSFMKQFGSNPRLVAISKRLLKVSPEKEALLASNELQEMRSFFKKNNDIFPNIGFFIIDPNHISIGSRRDRNVGSLNLISKQYPNLLKEAFEGKVGFVPPITSDVHLGTSRGEKKPPTMFFIGPIRDVDEKVIAVFTLRVDPWRDFSKAISSFEGFKFSEIYTFDENGFLLTPSRFDQQLRRIGLLAEDQGSALNIEIRDPGVNLLKGENPEQERSDQPLTHLVLRTLALKKQMEQMKMLAGHSKIETDTIGYRDYRGVPVFGAWLWNAHLKIGIAAEVDLEDALADYTTTRFMVITILGITLFLSVGAVLLVLVLGERASKALTKSRDNLEHEVEKRTAELQINQQQLEVSEERSRLLLNSAGEGIFGVDLNGEVIFINPAANHLLGYEPEALIGQKVHEKIHHSHADKSPYPAKNCPMSKAYTQGTTETISDEMLWRKDGTGFFVEYTATPLLRGTKISGAVITFRDITDRKQMEENLSAERERLQQILDTSPVGVAFSIKGKIHFANPRFNEMFGVGTGDESPSLYVNSEERNLIVSKLKNEGKIENYELQMYNGDRQIRDILMTYLPITIDEEEGILGWLLDISDRKQMEKALVAEKAHLQKILDTSPVGVGISTNGIMRFANPRMLEMINIKIDDPAPDIYVNIEDRNHIIATLGKYGIISDFELQAYGKDNKIIDLLATYMNISYEGKNAILSWVMDITDLKKTDSELREKFDELSRFRKLAVGRELKMVDIKKEINNLLIQQGKQPIYKIVK
jgi:PAS domain S-box-containing protein